MGKITELKTVVADEIPEKAWNIVSGRQTFPQSDIYKSMIEVHETSEEVTAQTGEENRLSLIVAVVRWKHWKTMSTKSGTIWQKMFRLWKTKPYSPR